MDQRLVCAVREVSEELRVQTLHASDTIICKFLAPWYAAMDRAYHDRQTPYYHDMDRWMRQFPKAYEIFSELTEEYSYRYDELTFESWSHQAIHAVLAMWFPEPLEQKFDEDDTDDENVDDGYHGHDTLTEDVQMAINSHPESQLLSKF